MIASRCDRRLSRAARELLRRHLIEAWRETLVLTSDAKYDVDVSEWNVWQFLEATLVVSAEGHLAHDIPCPLVPSLDVFMFHETSSRLVDGSLARSIQYAAIPGVMHSARKGNRPTNNFFHQCSVCQKNFTSPFYLDKHLDSTHGADELTIASRDLICPAITFCQFLSPIACFDQAMLLEPFYGPGSNGYGTDHHAVHHKLRQMQPICSEEDQRAVVLACREVVDTCFDGVFGQILSNIMCSSVQSCRSRFMHRMIGSSLMIHPEKWQESFTHAYGRRTLAWIGIAVMAFFLVLLYGFWVWRITRKGSSVRRSSQKSLLNNKVASKWSLSSPTTFNGPHFKMKKN